MFTTKTIINFFDCDPGGILFYANLFKKAHSAYEEMMNEFDLDRNYFFDDDYIIPIKNANAEFIKPMYVGQDVTIHLSVSQLRKSAFELECKFIDDAGNIAAIVKTIHVLVDKNSFLKTDIPEELKNNLALHLL